MFIGASQGGVLGGWWRWPVGQDGVLTQWEPSVSPVGTLESVGCVRGTAEAFCQPMAVCRPLSVLSSLFCRMWSGNDGRGLFYSF